jgi:hypothetical protein
MLVYNTNEDTDGGNGTGIYIWKGQWVPVQSLGGSLLCSGGTPKIGTTSRDVSAPRDAEAPVLKITNPNPNDEEAPAITYKWQSSTNLETNLWTTASGDATAADYTVPNTEEGTFYYRCVVKNACGTTISGVFTVHITLCENFPTVISNGALERAVKKGEKGETATLSVTGDGKGDTPVYQWQKSPDGTTRWEDITITGIYSNYTVPTADGGIYYYRCKVSNDCSWVFSKVFTVTVYPCADAPSITSPGEDQATKINRGSTAPELSVSASGEGTLSYQWQQSATGKEGSWTDVAAGGNAFSYSASTAEAGITFYRCVVSNKCGDTPSLTFKVQVTDCTQPPVITYPTVDQTRQVNRDGTLYLTVTTIGQGETPVYEWQTSLDGTDNWYPVDNGTEDTYHVPTETPGIYYYRCEVSNSCGPTTPVIKFTVTVHPCTADPSIEDAAQYEYEVNKGGTSPMLSVSANGHEQSVTYKWITSTSKDGTYQPANGSGYDKATYTVPSTSTAATTYYKCEVTNSCGTTTSGVYTVTVHPCTAAPKITTTTYKYTVVQDGMQDLTVSADDNGDTDLRYQWQTSTTGNSSWGNIKDATSATYTIPTGALGTFYYRCEVTNACGTTPSKTYTVKVSDCPYYVCTDCAFDYADGISGDVAKGKKPSDTSVDEDWAPNVSLATQSYDENDEALFAEFTKANKNLCVYKEDNTAPTTWPAAVTTCSGTIDGKIDWYLPNIHELRALYAALRIQGGNGTGTPEQFGEGGQALSSWQYWSSTEKDLYEANFLIYGNGTRSHGSKLAEFHVRCVRRMKTI